MAIALAVQTLVPSNPPEEWREPLSLSVAEHTVLVIRTLPALGAELFRQVLGTERPAEGSVSVYGDSPETLTLQAADKAPLFLALPPGSKDAPGTEPLRDAAGREICRVWKYPLANLPLDWQATPLPASR